MLLSGHLPDLNILFRLAGTATWSGLAHSGGTSVVITVELSGGARFTGILGGWYTRIARTKKAYAALYFTLLGTLNSAPEVGARIIRTSIGSESPSGWLG